MLSTYVHILKSTHILQSNNHGPLSRLYLGGGGGGGGRRGYNVHKVNHKVIVIGMFVMAEQS